jgi:AdoMet-dependent rRNA methyltransferase SPB1
MPVSSLIVGVDLDPIKPISGVTSLVGDITSTQTKAEIKKNLYGWQTDM